MGPRHLAPSEELLPRPQEDKSVSVEVLADAVAVLAGSNGAFPDEARQIPLRASVLSEGYSPWQV